MSTFLVKKETNYCNEHNSIEAFSPLLKRKKADQDTIEMPSTAPVKKIIAPDRIQTTNFDFIEEMIKTVIERGVDNAKEKFGYWSDI